MNFTPAVADRAILEMTVIHPRSAWNWSRKVTMQQSSGLQGLLPMVSTYPPQPTFDRRGLAMQARTSIFGQTNLVRPKYEVNIRYARIQHDQS